jgi:hypothetical protein
MVFHAEVYAIKACAAENADQDYKNRNIYILSDGQAERSELTKTTQNWSGTTIRSL